jgi:DNA-binding FadR family transcriptional regulator
MAGSRPARGPALRPGRHFRRSFLRIRARGAAGGLSTDARPRPGRPPPTAPRQPEPADGRGCEEPLDSGFQLYEYFCRKLIPGQWDGCGESVPVGGGGDHLFEVNRQARTLSRLRLHGQVADAMGRRIVSGEIAEGDMLLTEELASAEMAVSRTAYREAIKILTAKGLLESRPRVGTRVRPRTEWNMLDPDILQWAADRAPTSDFLDTLFEFRLVIEPAAARLAAEKQIDGHLETMRAAMEHMAASEGTTRENVEADLAFHAAILQASGNELLSSLSYLVETLLERSFQISTRRPGARAASVPLHQSVCDSILRGDATAAQEAMTVLLTGALADVATVVAEEVGARSGEGPRDPEDS